MAWCSLLAGTRFPLRSWLLGLVAVNDQPAHAYFSEDIRAECWSGAGFGSRGMANSTTLQGRAAHSWKLPRGRHRALPAKPALRIGREGGFLVARRQGTPTRRWLSRSARVSASRASAASSGAASEMLASTRDPWHSSRAAVGCTARLSATRRPPRPTAPRSCSAMDNRAGIAQRRANPDEEALRQQILQGAFQQGGGVLKLRRVSGPVSGPARMLALNVSRDSLLEQESPSRLLTERGGTHTGTGSRSRSPEDRVPHVRTGNAWQEDACYTPGVPEVVHRKLSRLRKHQLRTSSAEISPGIRYTGGRLKM